MTTTEYAKLRGCTLRRVQQLATQAYLNPDSCPYFKVKKHGARGWVLTLTPAEKQRLRELGVLK